MIVVWSTNRPTRLDIKTKPAISSLEPIGPRQEREMFYMECLPVHSHDHYEYIEFFKWLAGQRLVCTL